ncbi:uncharacterized protein LOC110975761 isoform X2 [Acanthaster planci]|nr:uncharacterized protein LOC110975761 isoform X2 [Acanthaster planci]
MDSPSLHVDHFFPIPLRDSISLRPLREKDAESVFRVVDKNRDFLSKFLPWVPNVITVQQEVEWLSFFQEQEMSGAGLHCGIFKEQISRDERVEEIIGAAGLRVINFAKKTAQFGYWLAEEFTGSGLCTLACRKLIEYGKAIGMERFEIHVAEDNLKSQAVALRLGFHQCPKIIKSAEVVNNVPLSHIVFVLQLQEPTSTSE